MNENNLIQIKPRSFVSRSAILEHFTCPYKHYLTYWAHGTGLHPTKQSLDLLIGSVVHRGLQHLFEHCRVEHPDGSFEEACVDQAVEVAGDLWRDSLSKRSLALKSSAEYDRLDWIIAEQECLWEGLIRAFAIYKLPGILEEYEILEVEKEEVFEGFSEYITFLGKADGLFLRKRDKALVVLSIKTTSQYADVTTRDILHDMQGVSETFLTQERIERAWKEFHDFNYQNKPYEDWTDEEDKFMTSYQWFSKFETCPKVFAVQYEYLVKGQRRSNSYGDDGTDATKEYYQQSFLCHPMKFDAVRRILLGKGGSTLNPAQYKWKWGKGRQPKGWEKTDIWNDIGIKTWIEMLATRQVQPELGHPFDWILHTPDLIVRSEEELKEWLVSTRFKAERIRSYVEEINFLAEKAYATDGEREMLEEQLQIKLWQYFEKNTLSCHDFYGNDCQYVRHCHELETIEAMTDAGDLIPRIPHHELEREDLIKKGLIEDE